MSYEWQSGKIVAKASRVIDIMYVNEYGELCISYALPAKVFNPNIHIDRAISWRYSRHARSNTTGKVIR